MYRDGRRQPCEDLRTELAQLHDADVHDHSFLWIGLKDPTPEEFDLVQGDLGLHRLAVEDALEGHQRAKIERYGDSLFVVLKPLHYEEATSQVETEELMLFVGRRFLLTVREGGHIELHDTRVDLEHTPELLKHGPLQVLHRVMDNTVDGYLNIVQDLADDLDGLEQRVFSTTADVDPSEIYNLKREVLETRRAAQPLLESLTRQMRSTRIPEEAMPFFRDIRDHLQSVLDQVDTYDGLLTDVLNAHLTQVSVRQNEDMRKISAWAAILALPTLLAGIYGMNFKGMPELTASFDIGGHEFYYGYYAVLLVMVGACSWLYRAFKRSGWL